MKKIWIIKTGTTFRSTEARWGDFDDWILSGLGLPLKKIAVLNVYRGFPLPSPEECAGVVVTGSHAMVTDNLEWSLSIEKWIPSIVNKEIPFLGICYGHQLLARAAGGLVGYHPGGIEAGTVEICRLNKDDILFNSLPAIFQAHVTHAQTVLELPSDAVRLASNNHEENQAFRLGRYAWGVQFHPEFSAPVMQEYIEKQKSDLAASGKDVSRIRDGVMNTPDASSLLSLFGQLANKNT